MFCRPPIQRRAWRATALRLDLGLRSLARPSRRVADAAPPPTTVPRHAHSPTKLLVVQNLALEFKFAPRHPDGRSEADGRNGAGGRAIRRPGAPSPGPIFPVSRFRPGQALRLAAPRAATSGCPAHRARRSPSRLYRSRQCRLPQWQYSMVGTAGTTSRWRPQARDSPSTAFASR